MQIALSEKRITLHHLSWAAYQTILHALGEQRSAQLTYYKGALEIMSPLEAHENSSSAIDQFINVLTEELNLTLKSLQSTTLSKAELAIGAEPDQCYYLVNEPLVRGKTVDLAIDPPPDLVVEIDITHTDINKTALYAEMQIPEFWRYNGTTLKIYQLRGDRYREAETSLSFPEIPKERLYKFLNDCAQQGETQAKRNLRSWLNR
jgi:Uma2 family endonuclease